MAQWLLATKRWWCAVTRGTHVTITVAVFTQMKGWAEGPRVTKVRPVLCAKQGLGAVSGQLYPGHMSGSVPVCGTPERVIPSLTPTPVT